MKSLRVALTLALLAASLPCFADLCEACRGKAFTKDIGTCSDCPGMTTSGSFKLCMGCSQKLQQCQACRAPLRAARPAPATIDTTRNGTHTAGRWEYRYAISNEGTRSEGYAGDLAYDGKPLPEPAAVNDHVKTPWGVLYWTGNPVVPFGAHRWMLRPRPSEPMGRLLPDPSGQPQSLVFVQVVAGDRSGGRPPAPEWVAAEMARRGVQGAAIQRDWFVLGEEAVTLHDSKHYGQASLALAPSQPGAPLVVAVSGATLEGDGPIPPAPPAPGGAKKPGQIELPFRDGEKKVVKCTLSSSVATMDLYLAIRVEASSAPAGGADK